MRLLRFYRIGLDYYVESWYERHTFKNSRKISKLAISAWPQHNDHVIFWQNYQNYDKMFQILRFQLINVGWFGK